VPKKETSKITKLKIAKPEEQKLLSKSEATKLRDGMLDDFKAAGSRLIAAAIKLDQIVRGQGWKALGYETMTEWREAEIKHSEFYTLRNTTRLLEQGVPPTRVEKMKLTNIDTLVRQLPSSEWAKETWLKAAAELPIKQFEAKAMGEAVERGTAQEEIERRGFAGPTSLIKQWDLALKVAETVDGAKRLEDRVEAIIATYLNSDSQQKGKSKLQRYQEVTEAIEVGADL